MKSHFTKSLGHYVAAHKIGTAVVAVILVWGGYASYKDATTPTTVTRYTLGTVTQGDIITTVSATGQVAALDQINVTPKASGEITSVDVTTGQTVKEGQVLGTIDATDALDQVRSAEDSLTNAQIAYQKAEQQSTTGVTNDVQSVASASSTLALAFEDAATAMSTAFIDIPSASIGMNDIYYTASHSPYFSDDQQARLYGGDEEISYKYTAGAEFDSARTAFNNLFAQYKANESTLTPDQIQAYLPQVLAVAKQFSTAINDTYNAIDYIHLRTQYLSTKPTQIAGDESELSGYLSSVNKDVSSLADSINEITTDQNNLQSSIQSLADTQTTLPDSSETLDMESAKLSVQQAQDNLTSAQETLADYTVAAPFDGEVAKVPVNKGDEASSGTTIATIITTKQIATLTLNEVDAAKIKVGQKATVTFDALPDVTMTGEVAEVDALGTVTQGVVTYSVEITFDTENDQVKSGMTATASIITNIDSNVLMVPNAAVKTSGSASYVLEIPGTTSGGAAASSTTAAERTVTGGTTVQVLVVVGDSNDTDTEITSGLNVGDVIVVSSTTAAAKTGTTAAKTGTTGSLTGILGGSTGGATRATGGGGAGFTRGG